MSHMPVEPENEQMDKLIHRIRHHQSEQSWIHLGDDLSKFGPRALPHVLKLTEDSDSIVRAAAAYTLGKIGHPTAAPRLIQMLEDYEVPPQVWAARSLGDMKTSSAFPHLVKALQTANPSVKQEALKALIKIDQKSAIPHVLGALKDPNSSVKATAAETLGKIEHPSVAPALIEALKDNDEYVLQHVIDALGERGESSAIPELTALLRQGNKKVARALHLISKKIGDRPVEGAEAQAMQEVAKHLHRADGTALFGQAYLDLLEKRVTTQNLRLYIKQLRAVEGRLK